MSIKTVALSQKLKFLDLLPPLVVEETASFQEVLQKMKTADRGSVIVCKNGVVSGIFTERDILNKHALESTKMTTPIKDVMTAKPVTITGETTIGEAVELMYSKNFRNLPLVDSKGRPQGLLTVGRIIRYLADHFPAEVMNLPPKLNQVTSESEGA